MNLLIHCAALLLVALIYVGPTSSNSEKNDKHDFYLQSTEANNFHIFKNSFVEHSDTANLKENERDPLLQDYIFDNIEINRRDDKINKKDFFHDLLFENKDTERVQIFKEYIPSNLIINNFKLINAPNEESVLPLFTDDLTFSSKMNVTEKIATTQIPDNFFPRKKDDMQIIKDFASNIKLNEMVQTIKNFFAEKATDNITDHKEKVIEEGNVTINNIKINDVVQSLKDYFSNKPNNNTKKDKILIPEDFFSTSNNNMTNEERLNNIVKKINVNKNKVFHGGENAVTDTDYNDTKKVEIVKNFLMDGFTENAKNKDPKLLTKTDMFHKTTIYKKNKINPIKNLPIKMYNDSDQEHTTQQLLPSCSRTTQNEGEYKIHIVKIIFPEKITSKGREEIKKNKVLHNFHKKPNVPEHLERYKIEDTQYPQKVLETQDSIYNKIYKVIENINSKNAKKLTVTNIIKTEHNMSIPRQKVAQPTNTEIIEDIENSERVEIPKNFFSNHHNDNVSRPHTTIINLKDFIPKVAFMHKAKGNASDIFNPAIEFNIDRNFTGHHKTKSTRITDVNLDNLFNLTSTMKPNYTVEDDDFILNSHIHTPLKILKPNNYQKPPNWQPVTGNNTPIKSHDRIDTSLINKTIFTDIFLKTDLDDYKKILVTNDFFTDNFVIYTSNHDIINIILPLNSLNFNEIAKSPSNTNNYFIFFIEADILPDSTKYYKGLYIYHNQEAKLLLADGRDVSAPIELNTDVYIATNEGISIYNHFKNTTQHYGTFNESLIAIAKLRNADIIYGLTEDKVLFNITNNGTQWKVVDKIDKPEAIVLDSANNLYFYSYDKVPYIFNGKSIIPVENIPSKPNHIQLLRPPLVTESGVPAIIDEKSYIIYPDGRIDIADFEFSVYPSALSVEAVIVQYFAFNKKLYKFSVKQLYNNAN